MALLLFLQTKGHPPHEVSRFLEQLPLPPHSMSHLLNCLGARTQFVCLGCLTNLIHPLGLLLQKVFPSDSPLLTLPFAACVLQPWAEKGFVASPVGSSAMGRDGGRGRLMLLNSREEGSSGECSQGTRKSYQVLVARPRMEGDSPGGGMEHRGPELESEP